MSSNTVGYTDPGPDRPIGSDLTIEFCEETTVVGHHPFTIGRCADLVIDRDNRFLHRCFLSLSMHRSVWVLTNVGRRLTATVSDARGRVDAFLSPGAALPIVFAETLVRFTAGPTTYEFSIGLTGPQFPTGQVEWSEFGDTTVGEVTMTPDQLRLVLAIAEPALVGGGLAATTMPSSGDAARRLGWTITKFNRKLDNVCRKLAAQGVRGLHGSPGRLASNRRARLVEHALAVGLVTRDDLGLLDAGPANHEPPPISLLA